MAVLDSLISPRWPHPPSLPSDILPCLSWEQLPETPTHYYVAYNILESDDNGKFPDDPSYEHPHQSCLYNLASHWHKNLDEIAEVGSLKNSIMINLLDVKTDLQLYTYNNRVCEDWTCIAAEIHNEFKNNGERH